MQDLVSEQIQVISLLKSSQVRVTDDTFYEKVLDYISHLIKTSNTSFNSRLNLLNQCGLEDAIKSACSGLSGHLLRTEDTAENAGGEFEINPRLIAVCFKLIGRLWLYWDGDEEPKEGQSIDLRKRFGSVLDLIVRMAHFKENNAECEVTHSLPLDDLFTLQASALKALDSITCTGSGVDFFLCIADPLNLLDGILSMSNCFVIRNLSNILLNVSQNAVVSIMNSGRTGSGSSSTSDAKEQPCKRLKQDFECSIESGQVELLSKVAGLKSLLVYESRPEFSAAFDRKSYKSREAVKACIKLLGELVVGIGCTGATDGDGKRFIDGKLERFMSTYCDVLASIAVFSPKRCLGEKGLAMGCLYHVVKKLDGDVSRKMFDGVCERLAERLKESLVEKSAMKGSEVDGCKKLMRNVCMRGKSGDNERVGYWELLSMIMACGKSQLLLLQGVDVLSCMPLKGSGGGVKDGANVRLLCLMLLAVTMCLRGKAVESKWVLIVDDVIAKFDECVDYFERGKVSGFEADLVKSLCTFLNSETQFDFALVLHKQLLLSSHIYLEECPETMLSCGWMESLIAIIRGHCESPLYNGVLVQQKSTNGTLKNIHTFLKASKLAMEGSLLDKLFEAVLKVTRVNQSITQLFLQGCDVLMELVVEQLPCYSAGRRAVMIEVFLKNLIDAMQNGNCEIRECSVNTLGQILSCVKDFDRCSMSLIMEELDILNKLKTASKDSDIYTRAAAFQVLSLYACLLRAKGEVEVKSKCLSTSFDIAELIKEKIEK